MKGKRRRGEKREKMQIFECDVVRVGLYIFFVQFCFCLSAIQNKVSKRVIPTRGYAYHRGYLLGKISVLLCYIYKPQISGLN